MFIQPAKGHGLPQMCKKENETVTTTQLWTSWWGRDFIVEKGPPSATLNTEQRCIKILVNSTANIPPCHIYCI